MLKFGWWLVLHRRLVLIAWAVILLVALPFVPRVFRSLNAGGFNSPDLEAFRAAQLLADRFGSNQSNVVLVYTDPTGTLSATSDQFFQSVDVSLTDVRSLPNVGRITTARDNPRQVAPDGQAQYVTIALSDTAGDVNAVLPTIQQALKPTQLEVTLTGAPVFYQDIFDVTERDLRRAELLSIPTAGIALVLVFGSVIAGAVPGVVGGTAVALTLALMVVLGQFTELSIFSLNLATMLGLGLGIDYSLFVVSRFREELARGQPLD
ncbi:MAG: MMPL family transporter, partial [Chloroflexi bacterium]|nr:MMPL family transporter [Chloroflexota bacterium]